MTICFAPYFSMIFDDQMMKQTLVKVESARSIIGRSATEVVEMDRRNMDRVRTVDYAHEYSATLGISAYPGYCGTEPSVSWWIAPFELVRVP